MNVTVLQLEPDKSKGNQFSCSTMYLGDLTDQEVSLICRTLQLSPSDDGLQFSNRTLSLLERLPLDLQRPHGLSRLVSPRQDDYTPLCALHKAISAPLVNSIFQFVALEAGLRLNKLVSNGQYLNNDQTETIQTVRRIHSLWLPAETYEMTFLEKPQSQHWPYQNDCCQACILSRIGGDLPTLLAFRAVLLSKTHRNLDGRTGPPSLLRWIQAWIASFSTKVGMDPDVFESTISANDADAESLKSVRRAISHASRSSRQTRSSHVAAAEYDSPRAAPADDEGPTDQDAEIAIIDHYAALMSTPHLPQQLFSTFSRSRPSTVHTDNGERTGLRHSANHAQEPIHRHENLPTRNRYVPSTVTNPRPASSIYSRATDAASSTPTPVDVAHVFTANADSDRQSTHQSERSFPPYRYSLWTNASIPQAAYTDNTPDHLDRGRRSRTDTSSLQPRIVDVSSPVQTNQRDSPRQSTSNFADRSSTDAHPSHRDALTTSNPPIIHLVPHPDHLRPISRSYTRLRPTTAHARDTDYDHLTPVGHSTTQPARPPSSHASSSTLTPSSLSHNGRESVMPYNYSTNHSGPNLDLNRSSSTRAIHGMRRSMQRDEEHRQQHNFEHRSGERARRSDASRETTWSRIVRAANGE